MQTNGTAYLDNISHEFPCGQMIEIITNPISGIAGESLYSECADKHKIPKEDETPASNLRRPTILFSQLSPAKL